MKSEKYIDDVWARVMRASKQSKAAVEGELKQISRELESDGASEVQKAYVLIKLSERLRNTVIKEQNHEATANLVAHAQSQIQELLAKLQ